MKITKEATLFTLIGAGLSSLLVTTNAFAAISFVSATGSAALSNTIDDNGDTVFVFQGVAENDSTTLTFSTDTKCPDIAMTGGAEFVDQWSCGAGIISTTLTSRGGMSFGPSPEGNSGSFYVSFGTVPTPPGFTAAPLQLSGIQIAVFGDVDRWDLSGDVSPSGGASFGVELGGPEGGDAHFRMTLPQAAVSFLGGVLGVYVGGKADPFASVVTNEDGSVEIRVDIATLTDTGTASTGAAASAKRIVKKITAGPRALGIAFKGVSVKSGKSAVLAMCAGTTFTAGDRVAVALTVAGKPSGVKKSFVLDKAGCAQLAIKQKAGNTGTMTAKISYKGSKGKASIKIVK